MSCDALRPDRRAIARCIREIASNMDESLANELTDILLEGDPVDIETEDKNASSAFRALRKLDIDYEILEWTKFQASILEYQKNLGTELIADYRRRKQIIAFEVFLGSKLFWIPSWSQSIQAQFTNLVPNKSATAYTNMLAALKTFSKQLIQEP